jgi:DNA-binding MarR family transcriptional regulator
VPSDDEGLDQLYEALSQLARGRRAGLHERLTARVGVTIDPPGRLLLRRIADEGEVRLGGLAGLVGLDPSTVSRKVQQLEQVGLLRRGRDREDRRAAAVSLTAEGKRLLRRFDGARRQLLAEVLAEWTPEDRLMLASLLTRFTADLARHGGRPVNAASPVATAKTGTRTDRRRGQKAGTRR